MLDEPALMMTATTDMGYSHPLDRLLSGSPLRPWLRGPLRRGWRQRTKRAEPQVNPARLVRMIGTFALSTMPAQSAPARNPGQHVAGFEVRNDSAPLARPATGRNDILDGGRLRADRIVEASGLLEHTAGDLADQSAIFAKCGPSRVGRERPD